MKVQITRKIMFLFLLQSAIHLTVHGQESYLYLPDDTTVFASAGSGNWDDNSTWNNGAVPTNNSIVLIKEGHVVKIRRDEPNPIKLIRIEGELMMVEYNTTKIRVETIEVMSNPNSSVGGIFRIGDGQTDPVRGGETATVSFITDGLDIDLNYDPKRISRGLLSYGNARIRVHGTPKTSKIVIGDITSGAPFDITNNTTIDGWEEGDQLVLPGTFFGRDEAFQDEILTINSVSGNIINISAPTHNHIAINDNSGNSNDKFDLHLVNLTRNVIFETKEGVESHISETHIYNRAHLMFMGKSKLAHSEKWGM